MRKTPPRWGCCAGAAAADARSPDTPCPRPGKTVPSSSQRAAGSSGRALDPRVHEAAAQIKAVVRLEPLHVRRVRDVPRGHWQVNVIGLVGEIAVDLVGELAALLRIKLSALGEEGPGQGRPGPAAGVP